ncbi:MAG: sigma 54-interacting transcriptional regulator [Elusimicrobia bacterium]|nr:sigma 54-interacting transcriptional regulator [Elusimicrobiota bacterium]
MAKVLIVDDEELIRWSLSEDLGKSGYKTAIAADVEEALRLLESESPDVILTDLRLGGASGIDLLKHVRRSSPGLPVILMTAFADLDSAIEALREGAADYIAKPLQLGGLKITLKRVLETAQLRSRLQEAKKRHLERYNFASIITASPSMSQAIEMARKIAASPYGTVLILGESGCGKDRLARAIHYESPRSDQSFLEISCTAIPDNLLESELFGHERGAFTDAVRQKKGLFELASGGTVFLNEIGHMSLPLQAKLLRFLEDKTFRRVGALEDTTVDVRIMAATNEDLEKAVASGRFRTDLYYRINVLTIKLLPLRQRTEDILPLAEVLLERICRELRRPKIVLPEATRQALRSYQWPGNVRELRNILERMVILGETDFCPPQSESKPSECSFTLPERGVALDEVERSLVEQAMRLAGGNQQKAAQLLNLSRDSLRRRLEKYAIKTITLSCMLGLLLTARSWAAWWGGDSPLWTQDPFLKAHEAEATKLKEQAGAHAPVKEGLCSSCHSDPADASKLKDEPKALCLSCHAQRRQDLEKSHAHQPFKDGDCSTCHQPHGSDKGSLLSAALPELCVTCHAPGDDSLRSAHFGVSEFSQSCTRCHSPHASDEPKLLAGKPHVPFESRSCQMCHKKGAKPGPAQVKETPGQTCFLCHSNFAKRGESPGAHPPFAAGDCVSCHDPHISRLGALRKAPLNEVCFTCHDEALKDNHPIAKHPTSKPGLDDPRRKGKPFDCASCHDPHASAQPKLIRGSATNLCEECHKK